MADLDELDFRILHLLQRDARHQTPVDMAERLPVSDQTIRNRIHNMEDLGVIRGYTPTIDYEAADFPIRLKISCTAPVSERERLATEALELSNVVRVEEMLSAHENVQLLVVAKDTEAINAVTRELDDLGLQVERERLLRREHVQPFNHFGEDVADDDR